MQLVSTTNQIFAIGTIIGQLFILAIIFSLLFFRKNRSGFLSFCSKYVLHVGFLISLAAVAVSLFYSTIIGFQPCTLCWWQRIFIYPQVILFGLALIKRDRRIIDYCLTLSIFGAIIALYNYYIGIAGVSLFPCAATAEAIFCAQRFVFEFGYITIPLMSLTAFLIIIVSIINYKFYRK